MEMPARNPGDGAGPPPLSSVSDVYNHNPATTPPTRESTDRLLRDLGIEPPRCRRILLVDDERDIAEGLAMLLDEFWDVFVAHDGKEALAVLEKEGAVDLVIADQRMPRMTGVELLAEVARRHPETLSFVLTGYSDVEPIVDAVNRGGVHRFLLKPVDPAELRAAVSEALDLKACRAGLELLVATLDRRRRELEDALRALHATRDELLRREHVSTVGRLTQGVVYELRNHVSGMTLLANAFRTESPDPEIGESAGHALAVLEHLFEAIRDLNGFALEVSREHERRDVDTRSLLDGALSEIRSGSRGRPVPTRIEVSPDASRLLVDAEEMARTLAAAIRHLLGERPDAPGLLVEVHLEDGTAVLRIAISEPGAAAGASPAIVTMPAAPSDLELELAGLGARAHGGGVEVERSEAGLAALRIRISDARPCKARAQGGGDA